MSKAYVFTANGCEEVEALTTVDLLRRGGVETVMVSITEDLQVTGSHGIAFQADQLFGESDFSDGDALILPGGMPGTLNLQGDERLLAELKRADAKGSWVCAICAAPRILGSLGLLKGQKATCYPGNEQYLDGAEVTGQAAEISGHFVTGKGAGCAVDFGLALLSVLEGKEKAEEIARGIQWQH
jgi:4-methyl-5(b-hydroxyethyl)-thiazole monophosphate biosynthesis